MQRHVHLLFSVLLIYLVLKVQADNTTTQQTTLEATPTPVITYSCNSSAVTSFKITGGDFKNIRLLKNTEICEPVPTNEIGVLNCTNKLVKGLNNGEVNITILYEDENNSGITGGKNIKYYLLSCKEKSSKKNATLIKLDIKPTEPSIPNEIIAEISAKPKLSIAGPTTIYVGTPIQLNMEIKEPYELLPETCTAYRNENDLTPYLFWKICDQSKSDKAIISELHWTLANHDGKNKATVNMYAFRFTETTSIIIKCETYVCPASAPECKPACLPVGRKRRNANGILKQKANVTVATAAIAFDVFERRQFRENSSQALFPAWYIYATGFGIIYWITMKKF